MNINIKLLSVIASSLLMLCMGIGNLCAQSSVHASGGESTGPGKASYSVGQVTYTPATSLSGDAIMLQGVQTPFEFFRQSCFPDLDPPMLSAGCGQEDTDGGSYADGWQTGDGDQSNFGQWALSSSGSAGHFLSNSTGNGDGDTDADGDIDLSGKSWGLFANSGGTSSAILPFTRSMASGSILNLDMDNGWIDAGGPTVGFGVQNASGENLLEFFFRGGQSSYEVNELLGFTSTGLGFTDEGLSISMTQLTATTMEVQITRKEGGFYTAIHTFLNPTGGQVPTQLRVFNFNAGLNAERNAYFNSIELCHACPEDVTVNNDAGQCGATLTLTPPTASDLCGAVTLLNDFNNTADASDTYPVGVTVIVWTATDAAGNSDTCHQKVTVIDNELPTITCPANISVNNDPGNCSAVVTYVAVTSTDNCPGETITQTAGLASGSAFPVGTTTNTFVVTDFSGNTDTCSFTVTVTDNEDPVITCPAAVSVDTDAGVCTASNVDLGSPIAGDNCSNIDNALDFDGSNDFVSIGNVSALNFERTDAFSIEAWVKYNGSGDQMILDKATNVAPFRGYDLWSNDGDISVFLVSTWNSNALYVHTNSAPLADGQWHHVTMSYSGNSDASGVNIYVDGVLQLKTVVHNSLSGSMQTTAPAQIGARLPGGSYSFPLWQGAMNEVRIWNTARTQAEIQANMNNELSIEAGLVASYHFNEGVADGNNAGVTTATDASGNGNDGTLNNFALTGTTSNWVAGNAFTIPTVTNDAPAAFPVGVTSVTWTATDDAGNTDTCVQTVTVNDVEDPTITCPADVTVNNDPGNCTASNVDLGTPVASDNCSSIGNALDFDGTDDYVSIPHSASLAIGSNPVSVECWFTVPNADQVGSIVAKRQPVSPFNMLAIYINDGTDPVHNPQPGKKLTLVFGSPQGSSYRNITTVNDIVDGGAHQLAAVVDPVTQTLKLYIDGVLQVVSTISNGVFPTIVNTEPFTIGQSNGNIGFLNVKVDELRIWNTARTQAEIQANMNNELSTATGLVASYHFNEGVADGNNAGVTTAFDASGNSNNGTLNNFTLNGSTSNWVGGQTFGPVITNNAPAIYSVGSTTLIWTATDASGNTDTCHQKVTVIDNEDPTIACPPTVTVDTDAGICTASGVTLGMPTVTDNCATITPTNDAPAVFPIGNTTVIWTADDGNGQVVTCTQIVTVEDNEAPVANCHDLTIYLDESGNATIHPTLHVQQRLNAGESPNEIYESGMPLDSLYGKPYQEGLIFYLDTVSGSGLLAAPSDGNFTSWSSPAFTINTGATGTTIGTGQANTAAIISTVGSAAFAASYCDNLTIGPYADWFLPSKDELNQMWLNLADSDGNGTNSGPSDPANLGGFTNAVYWSSTELNPSLVSVQFFNNGAPGASSKTVGQQTRAVRAFLATGASTQTSSLNNNSTDNCGIQSMTLSKDSFECADITSEIPCSDFALDFDGVNDYVSIPHHPLLKPSSQITIEAWIFAKDLQTQYFHEIYRKEDGLERHLFSFQANGTILSCGLHIGGSYTELDVPISPSDFENQWVHVAAVYDGSTRTVYRNGIPIGSDAKSGPLGTAGTQDAIIGSRAGVNEFFDGLIDEVRVWRVGRSQAEIQSTMNRCLFGNENDLVGYWNMEDGSGSVVTDLTGTSNGSLTNMDPSTDWVSGAPALMKTGNLVYLVVTDNYGNSDTCKATIIVLDTVKPVAICKNIAVQLDETGNATIRPGLNVQQRLNAGESPNEIYESGMPLDSLYGKSYQEGLIFYLDTVSGSGLLAAPSDGNFTSWSSPAFTINTGATGTTIGTGQANTAAIISTVGSAAFAASYCDNLTIGPYADWFLPSEDELNQMWLNLADSDGNGTNSGPSDPANLGGFTNAVYWSSTELNPSLVSVQFFNNGAPGASFKTVGQQIRAVRAFSATGTSTQASSLNNNSTDNCGGLIFTEDITDFSCSDVGANTVTLTVGDANGNLSTCQSTVTVSDTIKPLAVCNDITIDLPDRNPYNLTQEELDSIASGSSDNCSFTYSIVSGTTSYDCDDRDLNLTLTLQVTDASGNMDSCDATVSITDTNSVCNDPPVAVCRDITVYFGSGCKATIVATDIDNGSSDPDFDPLTFTIDSAGPFAVGMHTVTLYVTDGEYVDSCSAMVTVEDTISPVALCKDITVYLDNSGNAYIDSNSVDNGSSDNCGIASIITDQTTFTCVDVPSSTVTMTVTDVNGNSNTCSSVVTIFDTIPPSISCPDDTIILNDSGICRAVFNYNPPIGTDNCPGAVTNQASGFGSGYSYPVFTNITELYVVTDASGNKDSCSFTIDVIDAEVPTVNCPATMPDVYLNNIGSGFFPPNIGHGGISDNCGVGSVTNPFVPVNCSDIGTQTVVITARDGSNNKGYDTCTFNVFDTIDPYFYQCPPSITVKTDLDSCNAVVALFAALANDNCGSTSVNQIQGLVLGNAFPLGVTTNIFVATDASGNTDTCSYTIIVNDSMPPNSSCKDITVQLDATGNQSIAEDSVDNGSSDACGIATYDTDVTDLNCNDVPSTTVTLTVTDVNGNSSSCTSTVTVSDTVKPIATCKDITVQLDATGNQSIAEDSVDNGSSDACGIATYDTDITDFNCNDVPSTTVTLTVTDVNGNSSSCTSTVTVSDTVKPIATCRDITIQLDATGNQSIAEDSVDNGSSDACGIATYDTDITDFNCNDVPSTTVTLTVTDVNGNSSSCTSIVTVSDTVKPIATCRDIIVQLDATGNQSIAEDSVDNGSSDACGIATYDTDITDFNCNDVPSTTVTLTVTDVNGNSSSCTSTVTVLDTVAPVMICKDLTVYLDEFGIAAIDSNTADNGTTDNCGIASMLTDQTSFNCSDIPSTTVTMTSTDINGNSSSCTSTVTVQDTIAPIALCKGGTFYFDANGEVNLEVSDIDNGSSDECTDSIAINPVLFSCDDAGNQNVSLTITDKGGNSTSCTSVISLVDTTDPVAVCKDTSNIFLNNNSVVKITPVAIDNGSYDNCDFSLSINRFLFTCANLGYNSVILTITDEFGASDACVGVVNITETKKPLAKCKSSISIPLDANGNATITPQMIDNGSSDNCGIVSKSVNITQLHCVSNVVTLTVADASGNSSSCATTVYTMDNTAPNALCNDLTLTLNISNSASINLGMVDGGSTDGCGIASRVLSQSSFGCADLGVNAETLTVTDNSGNIAVCNFTVTILTTDTPMAICKNVTVVLDSSGNAGITLADIDNGSQGGGCGGGSASVSMQNFDCSNLGSNTVTLTITGAGANQSACTSTVTVIDTASPSAVCPVSLSDVILDANGNGILAANIGDGSSTDNCSVTETSPAANYGCADVGAQTVVLTASDPSSNSNTVSCTFNVVDNEAPVAVCPASIADVVLDANGNGTLAANIGDGSSTDNCSATETSPAANYSCADVGAQTVVLTATDASGNSSSVNCTFNVVDNEAPAAVCPASISDVVLDSNGNGTLAANIGDGSSTDNCSVTETSPAASYSCADVGSQVVVLTATDASGNSSSVNCTLNVVDNEAPVAVCPASIADVVLDGNGNGSLAANIGDASSTDNCSVTETSPAANYSCADVGPQVVVLTATDASGNSSSVNCSFNVVDNEAPVAVCPASIADVVLDGNGNGSLAANIGDASSTDNCSVTETSPVANFSCADVGTQNVVLTTTDASGNSSSVNCTFNVVDNEAPVAVCPANIADVVLDGNGNGTLAANIGDASSTDNCSATETSPAASYSCGDVGSQTVVLTATDASGNSSSVNCTFNVVDSDKPQLSCQDATIKLDEEGKAVITISQIVASVSDACGISSITADRDTLSCADTGTLVVTVIVTDSNGNTSSCLSNVTVEDNLGVCGPQCPAPTNLTSVPQYKKAVLSWNAVPNAVKYIVEGGEQGGSYIQFAYSGTSFTATGLKSGTSYEWHVRAVCNNGDTSSYAQLVTFTTLSCATPQNLSVTNLTPTSAKLNWDVVPGAIGYRLIGGVGAQILAVVNITGSNNNSFNASSLASGVSYNWAVYAICNLSPFIISPISTVNTFTTPNPGAKMESGISSEPLDVSITPNPNDGQFVLEFLKVPAECEVVMYDIAGKEIYREVIKDQTHLDFDMKDLEKGIYMIKVLSGSEFVVKKVILN